MAAAGAAGGLARAAFRAKRKLCLNDETATDAVHRFGVLQSKTVRSLAGGKDLFAQDVVDAGIP